MSKVLKLHLFFCLLFFSVLKSQERFGQTENFNNLVKSIQVLPLLDKDGVNHNIPELRNTIESKLNYAQTYLTIELTKLVLSDSSDYYERKIKELTELEGKKLKGKDSLILLNEKEKLYLLTSVLKPLRSDTCLFKLIKIWYGVTVPVAFTSAQECKLNYKIWLYELGENRFAKEKEVAMFTKRKELIYLRKAWFYCDLPYRSIAEEKLNVIKGKKLISLSKQDSLNYVFYIKRATKLSDSNLKNKTDSLTEFIEQLWIKAYELNPTNYSTNYNLFIFYYNEGATLMKSIEYGISEKELNRIQGIAKKLFEKATYYAEKIGLADKYKDQLKVD